MAEETRCQNCGQPKPGNARVCPSCGYDAAPDVEELKLRGIYGAAGWSAWLGLTLAVILLLFLLAALGLLLGPVAVVVLPVVGWVVGRWYWKWVLAIKARHGK